MTQAQRILIVIGLPVLALILHVALCDWVFNFIWYGDSKQAGLFAFQNPGVRIRTVTGVLSEPGIEQSTALIWGIVIPLALLLADAWLILGWRHQSRIARGLCANCGYNLRRTPGDKCPECGKVRAKSKVES